MLVDKLKYFLQNQHILQIFEDFSNFVEGKDSKNISQMKSFDKLLKIQMFL
jgi:hypothetical protein